MARELKRTELTNIVYGSSFYGGGGGGSSEETISNNLAGWICANTKFTDMFCCILKLV